MKRQATEEPKGPDAKRAKQEGGKFEKKQAKQGAGKHEKKEKTIPGDQNRPLTKKEEDRLEKVRKMYDQAKNGGKAFDTLCPISKLHTYWFHCDIHKVDFQKTMRDMVVEGYKHAICKKKMLHEIKPELEPYFAEDPEDADAPQFKAITPGTSTKYKWMCEKFHYFEESPKILVKRKFICKICHDTSKSLKTLHPELEGFYVKKDGDPEFSTLSGQTHQPYTWRCDKKRHYIVRSPHDYVKNKTHQCEECAKSSN
jgi:hypothetical protein